MHDALIIGGGPAGAAAAIRLARAGRAVMLLERHAGPAHKVCGDFLSTEALAQLAELGVDLASLAPEPIHALRLIHGERVATTNLPFPACGVTRRALDEALLQRAIAAGADVRRGVAVRAVHGMAVQLSDGMLRSRRMLLATGKHALRGAEGAQRAGNPVGLKMYWRLTPSAQAALHGHIELLLFDGGYAGLQPVEAGEAVLCMLVSQRRLQAVGGSWEKLLAWLLACNVHLAGRLDRAEPLLPRPLAVAGLAYGYRHRPSAETPPGLFRLGDQAAVIPSLAGDGVALALGGSALACRTLLQGGSAAEYHLRLRQTISTRFRLATALHRLALTATLQPWLVGAAHACPGGLRFAAAWTRAAELAAPDTIT